MTTLLADAPASPVNDACDRLRYAFLFSHESEAESFLLGLRLFKHDGIEDAGSIHYDSLDLWEAYFWMNKKFSDVKPDTNGPYSVS